MRHGHQNDPAYDSVILHIVYDNDLAVYRKSGDEIPVIRLSFNPILLEKYKSLIKEDRESRECFNYLGRLDKLFMRDWLGKLMIERLEEKTGTILPVLIDNHYNWDDCLYKTLAVSFGMKLNAEPFRLLAESIPLNFIMKYRDNPKTINAAFFGQAGFLDELLTDDPYYAMLQKEYNSIKTLLPPPIPGKHLWKFMRSRPAGFPTARIPQLVSILVNSFPAFEKIAEAGSVKELREILISGSENYWVNHFMYGKPGRRKITIPGKDTIDLILINAVVPLLFLYGKFRLKDQIRDRALDLLEELAPENNEILKKWEKFGVKSQNAFDSQAIIQLETRYCLKKRCIECYFGNKILQDYD
jgi:hypothetical protein